MIFMIKEEYKCFEMTDFLIDLYDKERIQIF